MNESAHSISYSNRTIRASFGIKYSETFNMKKHTFETFFCVYKMKNSLLERISCLKNKKDAFEAFCILKNGNLRPGCLQNGKLRFRSVLSLQNKKSHTFEVFLCLQNQKITFSKCFHV